LAALHAHLGVARAVIVQASCHGNDNAAMLDAIAAAPHRYRGVAIVDDSFGDADFEALHRGGVRGVRFNFVRHLGGAPDMDVFWRVIDRIKERGWHVVLHLDASDVVPLSGMMGQLPLPFVIDHMARVPAAAGTDQPALRALLDLAKLERCWIKVSGSERIDMPPYDAAIPIAHVIVAAAPERVLWGTDFPHPNPTHVCDEADLVDLVPRFAPDAATQHKLLVDNPVRLYGFGAP
jgi:2-pyrone-4,6-dicarboxylate lactonase